MGAGALFAGGAAISTVSEVMNAYTDKKMAKYQAQQFDIQSQQLDLQKEILSDQYRTKRDQLQGDAIATAGANGVKVSGSVAESISNSLTELGMEESYRKFNIDMEKNNLNYEKKMTKINARNKFYASLLNAGTNAMLSAATYKELWGTPTKNVTGTAKSGGNIKFTNASYIAPQPKKPTYRG